MYNSNNIIINVYFESNYLIISSSLKILLKMKNVIKINRITL